MRRTDVDEACAEFADLSDRDIEARLQKAGAGWTPDKVKRAERCLKARMLADKKAETADQVRVAWAGIILAVIVAIVTGLYAIWPHVIEAIAP
jgi:hypothetical protein